MATTPSFATTPNNASISLAGVDASPPVGTNASTVITAGANGTLISEVDVECSGTVAAGIVYLFLHDGTTFRVFDTVTVTATTPSTTVPGFRASKVYTNLILKTGYTLRAAMSVAPSTGTMTVHAFAADY